MNKHHIALELSYGMIYCNSCKDYMYYPECQTIAEVHLKNEAMFVSLFLFFKFSACDALPDGKTFLEV